MNSDYPHKEVEEKSQEYWDQNKIFYTTEDKTKKKFYALSMFPYPKWQITYGTCQKLCYWGCHFKV
jgi:leucyl-tRNA synthetase